MEHRWVESWAYDRVPTITASVGPKFDATNPAQQRDSDTESREVGSVLDTQVKREEQGGERSQDLCISSTDRFPLFQFPLPIRSTLEF